MSLLYLFMQPVLQNVKGLAGTLMQTCRKEDGSSTSKIIDNKRNPFHLGYSISTPLKDTTCLTSAVCVALYPLFLFLLKLFWLITFVLDSPFCNSTAIQTLCQKEKQGDEPKRLRRKKCKKRWKITKHNKMVFETAVIICGLGCLKCWKSNSRPKLCQSKIFIFLGPWVGCVTTLYLRI